MKKKCLSLICFLFLCFLLTSCTKSSEKGELIDYWRYGEEVHVEYLCDNGDHIYINNDRYIRFNAESAVGKFKMNGCDVEFFAPQIYQCGPGSTGCYYLFAVTPVDLSNADEAWLQASFFPPNSTQWNFEYTIFGEETGTFEYIGIYYDSVKKIGYIIDASMLYQDIYTHKDYRYVPYEDVKLEVTFKNDDTDINEFSFYHKNKRHVVTYSTMHIDFDFQATAPYESLNSMGDEFMDALRDLLSKRSLHPKDVNNYLKTLD